MCVCVCVCVCGVMCNVSSCVVYVCVCMCMCMHTFTLTIVHWLLPLQETHVVAEDLRLCAVKNAEDMERRFCFEIVAPTK